MGGFGVIQQTEEIFADRVHLFGQRVLFLECCRAQHSRPDRQDPLGLAGDLLRNQCDRDALFRDRVEGFANFEKRDDGGDRGQHRERGYRKERQEQASPHAEAACICRCRFSSRHCGYLSDPPSSTLRGVRRHVYFGGPARSRPDPSGRGRDAGCPAPTAPIPECDNWSGGEAWWLAIRHRSDLAPGQFSALGYQQPDRSPKLDGRLAIGKPTTAAAIVRNRNGQLAADRVSNRDTTHRLAAFA